MPKRKATSDNWNYFGYKQDDIDQTRVLCQQCLASVATKRGNTTYLFDHLRWYHTAQYEKKKQVRSVQVNCPQDSRSAASHKVLFKSSDENSFIFSYHNIYRRVKIKSQCQFFPISCSPNSYFHKILTQ